jgi:hypothetical protein
MMKLFKTLALCFSVLLLLLPISGCQGSHDGKAATHMIHDGGKGNDPASKEDAEASNTIYQVSKPLVKDMTMNDEYVCQIRAIQHIEIRSLEKGYLKAYL